MFAFLGLPLLLPLLVPLPIQLLAAAGAASETKTEAPSPFSCSADELFYNASASPACDANCQDLSRPCPLLAGSGSAVAGCYCRPGFARNLRQRCIPQDECKNDCFPNERPIAAFGRACEISCRPGRAKGFVCYSASERRCVCASGSCRDGRGRCVREV